MTEFRALLLTDVVDSTKLSEAIGDKAMAEVWTAHDRVARDLLPQWRGREIDKTDGMLLLFDTAADAVFYALHYHRALADMAVPLKARAGLHVGPVILRENSAEDVARGAKLLEVDGLAKPTAARVMSLARGGQTLLTPEARAALGETVLMTQSHGHWMIKGVADPIELFEVGFPEHRFIAPADSEKVFRVVQVGDWWMPVKQVPNNLPHQGTSFIGREREMDEVKDLLGSARLVTLLGMGGLGKTRLSLQVAAEQLHLYPDGVWFLDLAPLSDPTLVVAEAARVLVVPEEPGRSPLHGLCTHLKARRALLILDNCEHLIKPVAELAHAIVKAAPNVRMIASSREALHIPGERAYPILPLPVPERLAGLDALSRSTAVRLFVERAQAHKPAFELNEREAPAIAELVARLEGIPLALELAAARVRSLSVADINTRLKDRYKLLTGGSRVLQERQQTLRALMDWSYELLNENEQQMLRRLAVFVGGFNLDAAERVCGVEPIEDFEVLDLTASLVEKSLVMLEERDEGSRYRMLETIREYSREKLDQDADEAAATAARHCEHFFEFVKEASHGMDGPEQGRCMGRLDGEIDNIRSAIALSLSGAVDAIIAVKLFTQLQGYWQLRGYCTEGRRLVHAALALPDVERSSLARAHALYVGAVLAVSQADHAEARAMLETCLVLRRELGDPGSIAATLQELALAYLHTGDTGKARAYEMEALAIARQQSDRLGEAISQLHLGRMAIFESDLERARANIADGLAISHELDYRETEGLGELLLGEIAMEEGRLDDAYVHFESSLAVCRDAADKRGEASALWRLGGADLRAGKLPSARTRLSEALVTFRAADMWRELLGCLEEHASLAHLDGAAESAVRIAATVAVARQRLGLAHSALNERHWQQRLDQLGDSLPGDVFAAVWDEARSVWDVEDAVHCALSGTTRVDVAASQ